MALAVAVTDALPLEPRIIVVAKSFAEGPPGGGGERRNTPGQRLAGIVGRDGDGQGLTKAVPGAVDCGVLPATGVTVKPWLWKAPISGLGESRGSPRWSVVTPATATPAPNAGLPGSRAMVWVGPP